MWNNVLKLWTQTQEKNPENIIFTYFSVFRCRDETLRVFLQLISEFKTL